MTENQFFLQMLKRFSAKATSDTIDFNQFAIFVRKTAEKNPEFPGVKGLLSGDINSAVETGLKDLEKQGFCNLIYQGVVPVSIGFPMFYTNKINTFFRAIEDNSEIPFPTEERLGIYIPPNMIMPTNVKEDFSRLLEHGAKEGSEIYRLSFPDGVDSMIITSDLIASKLLDLSVAKIRLYLNTAKNADYIKNKLSGIFRQREQILKELFTTVQTQNRLAIDSITNPTEFTYLFWTHTASAVLAEYRQKNEKLVLEHSFCQAAFLCSLYTIHHKGITQKKKEKESAFRGLEQNLRKPPYFYSIKDISGFKDPHGLLISRKITTPELSEFLKKMTSESSDGKMPEIIHVKSGNGTDYFICKDKLLTLCLRKVIAASQEYRKHFIDDFKKNMEEFRKTEAMTSDAGLVRELESLLSEEDPFLHALLRYDLLYLVLEETKPGDEIRQETERLFEKNKQTLISLDHIFRLDRKTLLAKAKKLIPLWKTMKPLVGLVILIERLFSGKRGRSGRKARGAEGGKREAAAAGTTTMSFAPVEVRTRHGVATAAASGGAGPAGGAAGARGGNTGGDSNGSEAVHKDSMVEYRKAIYQLKVHFAGKDASIDGLLKDLADKWNPLYDPGAKANLVEDVNSFVRDYLRSLKKGFIKSPPDASRITNLAKTLTENRALGKIKKKDYLAKYIELYMIKYLGQK